ncbi:helix-turn-helix domain-containing protein [Clostridium botulinum]|uniref:helix-turn-helix domain-containing protein n=1 Tax=Clostridium botulinum TaxID=1491 RepID=UPI0019D1C917|nr:helix-turn-helix domain-containing protein [Clostridium botulinum]
MYRRQGYSYEKICKLINVSKSTVAAYCRRHDIRPIAHAKESRIAEQEKDENVFCKYCGSELIQSKRGKPKKFCSEPCRRSWWKEHEQALDKKAYYLITCKNCNKLFESYGNKNRKYCCHECYVLDVFTQKRESLQDIGEIISESLNEIISLTSCKRADVCTVYTGKILSKKVMNKLIDRYSTLIYELQNKGMEEK